MHVYTKILYLRAESKFTTYEQRRSPSTERRTRINGITTRDSTIDEPKSDAPKSNLANTEKPSTSNDASARCCPAEFNPDDRNGIAVDRFINKLDSLQRQHDWTDYETKYYATTRLRGPPKMWFNDIIDDNAGFREFFDELFHRFHRNVK